MSVQALAVLHRALLALALLVATAAIPATAEQGILVVQVGDTAGRPLADLQIGVKGDGSMARTGSDGKARIVLAGETSAGSPVTLLLGRQDTPPGEVWVFRSPAGGRTIVPSFENDSEHFVPVVLESRADQLEVETIVDKLVASRMAELRARDVDLEQQIRALGAAVSDLAARADDPDPPEGIDEALAELADGRTEAAEGIFRDVLERESRQAEASRAEAAAAARHLGALAFLNDTHKALDYYRRAVELNPESWEGWNQLGHLLRRTGDLAEAEAAFLKVLGLGTTRSDASIIAIGTGNLGRLYWARGELDEARTSFLRALDLFESSGDKEGIAKVHAHRWLIPYEEGELAEAESVLRQALRLFEEIGHQQGMASVYGNLGLISRSRGDLEAAEALIRRALELNRQLGRREGMALLSSSLGRIHRDRGDLETAESFFRQALDLAADLDYKEQMAIQYERLGGLALSQGALDQAESHFRQALELNRRIDRREGIAQALAELGRVHGQRGDLDLAESLHLQALALNEALERKQSVAISWANLGYLSWRREDRAKARSRLERALVLYDALGLQEDVKRVAGWLAYIAAEEALNPAP